MIKIHNLFTGYGKTEVLHDISLNVKKGEITTIIGKNGCGKSTLLKSITGFIPISMGDILIDGVSVKTMSGQDTARKIAYLSQGKNVPDITADRMVLHGRFPYLAYPRKYGSDDLRIAHEAMEEMGIADLSGRYMAELSGGMRQKVYIAMALSQQAPVIVMDEPTTYLDVGQQIKFAHMIKALADKGKTVILVLHDILTALKISDSVAVMENGRVTEHGTPEHILNSGIIEKIYGVKVKTISTQKGVQYFYETE